MDNSNHERTATKRRSNQTTPIEIFKDILIVLLLCSAIFLLWEAQLLAGLVSPLGQTEDVLLAGTQTYQVQAEAARPIRMAAILEDSNQMYGVQYNDEGVDALFQLSSTILRETLGSLDDPIALSEQEWREMLTTAPGLYFDMAGDVPLSVLAGWLSGQEVSDLTAVPRRMLLTTTDQGLVALCYQTDQGFYCATTQVVDSSRLSAVVAQCVPNGTQFAFLIEGYQILDPYTLLSVRTPSAVLYHTANPISTDESRSQLISLLEFDSYGSSTYTSTDGLGIVIRSDTDTLRIYGSGIVTYQGEAGHSLYPISPLSSQPTAFDVVESCRTLVANALTPFCGDARIQLLSVEERENGGWTVNFCYTLNGSAVLFSDGSECAQFIVENGEILEFTLRLRNYTATTEEVTLLPEILAAAALEGLGYENQELTIAYTDSGATYATPDWVASDR